MCSVGVLRFLDSEINLVGVELVEVFWRIVGYLGEGRIFLGKGGDSDFRGFLCFYKDWGVRWGVLGNFSVELDVFLMSGVFFVSMFLVVKG